jgi:hypothetical protein
MLIESSTECLTSAAFPTLLLFIHHCDTLGEPYHRESETWPGISSISRNRNKTSEEDVGGSVLGRFRLLEAG